MYYVLSGSLAILLFAFIKGSYKKRISVALFSSYLFFILSCTLIAREGGDSIQFNFSPFWTYKAISEGGWKARILFQEVVMNIFMLIPVGFFLPALTERVGLSRTVIIGFLLSVFIEGMQLISYRGFCEIDDIIHNTLGVICGYGLFKVMIWFRRKMS